ncbi:hypothetical protein SLS62_010067 [Diatrype stigma]|uniref:PH domain-containing protein n=1 Tax=Diatrype stigma TaxID=117547 RepID=A0AAN9UID8_9PEZI
MSGDSQPLPLRQGTTMSSQMSDEAVPETDPTSVSHDLSAKYIGATEKIHKAHAKEYEKVLKTISQPLREGAHFDQSLGGVAGLFENMRSNSQQLVNSNLETEKTLKGTVLPIFDRLHKEIKAKHKEVTNGVEKGAKEIDKTRNNTQKHIELLGQQAAAFESTGGKLEAHHDPYIVQRGVLFRLNKQVMEENNHRNDLIHVQDSFQQFEAHIILVLQQGLEAFNQVVGGQADKTRALYADMLGTAQRIPGDLEWRAFQKREAHRLVNPADPPRSVDAITFPNQSHPSTKPLIEGSLERKSRNKLSWGTQSGYYVVTPAKFLHEFKDDDVVRQDPKPELSMYLPDAVIGAPSGDKFSIKGKDKSGSFSSKLAGSSELHFKAHSAAEAQKWFEAIRVAAGATGPAYESGSSTPTPAGSLSVSPPADSKEQEAGITGKDTVSSPAALSPQSTFKDEKATAS